MSQKFLYSDADIEELLSVVIVESCTAEQMQELVETVGSFQEYAKGISESRLSFFTPDIAPEHFMLRDVLFTIADAYGWELSQWAVSGKSNQIWGYPVFTRRPNGGVNVRDAYWQTEAGQAELARVSARHTL